MPQSLTRVVDIFSYPMHSGSWVSLVFFFRNFSSFCFRRLCLKASEEVLLLDPRKHVHELDRRKDGSLRPDVFDSTSLRLGETTSPGAGPTSNGAEAGGNGHAAARDGDGRLEKGQE